MKQLYQLTQYLEVMVSTSGSQLLPTDGIKAMREHLFPVTTVLTPNVPEALLILADAGHAFGNPKSVDDLISLAKAIQKLGPKYVLVKGGHLPLKMDGTIALTEAERELMVDILYGKGEVFRIEAVYQGSKNTHGTGCSLACTSPTQRLQNCYKLTL
jgi:hydroxymethylpyrimidine kinase/phosphomethylpyrimidine kinase